MVKKLTSKNVSEAKQTATETGCENENWKQVESKTRSYKTRPYKTRPYKTRPYLSLGFIVVLCLVLGIALTSCADCNSSSNAASGNEQDAPRGANLDPNWFVSTWKTDNPGTSEDDQIALPLVANGLYDFAVDWGDGQTDNITNWDNPVKTHSYASAGKYSVIIDGTIVGWKFGLGKEPPSSRQDAAKLVEVSQWGTLGLGDTAGYQFYAAENLTITASDAPLLYYTVCGERGNDTDGNGADGADGNGADGADGNGADGADGNGADGADGNGADDADGNGADDADGNGADGADGNGADDADGNGADDAEDDGKKCDEIEIYTKDLTFAFGGSASRFTGKLNSWDVSRVESMDRIFSGAGAFNQDISSWKVANVTNMTLMFSEAEAFNQPIGSWDVSAVTEMHFMFHKAMNFNHPLSNWNVAYVTNMHSMFNNATNFNQDISDWSVDKVINCQRFATGSPLADDANKSKRPKFTLNDCFPQP